MQASGEMIKVEVGAIKTAAIVSAERIGEVHSKGYQ